MSDNVAVTAGSGTTIAADEVVDGTLGTVKVQFVKIMDATLDGTTKAAVGANGLAVNAAQGTAAAVTAGWPTISGQPADTTGTFTNATQTTSVTTGTINGYESVTVSINGTFGTATAVFEVSDDGGTTWYGTQGARSDSATVESGYTTLTNTSRMWVIPVTGADQFRVRSTAVASGTVNVRISPTSAPSADAAVVSLGAAIPAGSNVIGSLTANQSVNNAQFNGVTPLMGNGVTGTGSLRVTIASDNTAYSVNAVQSGTWNIGTVTTLTGITNALPAGTNLMGKVGIDQTTAGITNGVVPNATSATGGIATTTRLLSAAASTNATSAKASAGRLYAIQGYNAATTVRYLKLYNKASAPTVGTDTPVKTLALPPGVGFAFDWPVGYSFATGIAFALTTGSPDADTGALTAADVLGLNLDYV